MPRLLPCPHCQATAIPSWRRYVNPNKLGCRACGQRSRVSVRTKSLTLALLLSLVVLPVALNLFVFAIVAIRLCAPFLFWPFLATCFVAGVWLSGQGTLIPVPTATTTEQGMGAAAAARSAVDIAIKGLLPVMLGIVIADKSIHWWMPLVRAWLQG